MKRILRWCVALAAAPVFLSTSHAADIRSPAPPPPVVKAPAYVPAAFTWAGFYLGGNVGWGWSNGSGRVTSDGTGPLPVGTGPVSGDGDGFAGGVQAGYNWQTGPLVYGLETDFQLSDGKGPFSGNVAGTPFSGTAKNEWFGTIRGRVGYAVDRWLVYVTGGAAYSHNKISGTAGGTPFSASKTGWTWTLGGGVETAVWQNWSVKAEYLYLGEPNEVPRIPGTRLSGTTDTHLVRVGLNYRF
jgi:outer membrane immunogenic protein